MRTATFFAFFLAMFATVCSFASAEVALEKRAPVSVATTKPEAGFEATVDFLFKEHSKAVLEAFTDICLDADIETSISGDLSVSTWIGTKKHKVVELEVTASERKEFETELKTKIRAEVEAVVEQEFKAQFKLNIKKFIEKKCPLKNNSCIKTNAKLIVKEAAKLSAKISADVSAKLETSLKAKLNVAIKAGIKKLQVNIPLFHAEVKGDVKLAAKFALKFKAVVKVCAKALLGFEAKWVSQIKALCK